MSCNARLIIAIFARSLLSQLFIIASRNLNAFTYFSLYAQLVQNVFSTLTSRSLPFSCQAKSYYLTIDRSNFSIPAIRLRIKILLFTATSFPIGGLPTRFLSHLPSLTFLRTCAQGGAWIWCMGLLRNVAGKLDFIKRPSGASNPWPIVGMEIRMRWTHQEAIASVDVTREMEKLFAFDLALERVVLRGTAER